MSVSSWAICRYTRPALVCRACQNGRISRIGSRPFATKNKQQIQSQTQAQPIGHFYQSIIDYHPPFVSNSHPNRPPVTANPKTLSPASPKSNTSSTAPPTANEPATTAEDRARIVFGSKLSGPAKQAERIASRKAQSTYVAGVLIPPKPDEPDNCCMSGCVNCVWELYREEMEEYTAANKLAQEKLATPKNLAGEIGDSSTAPTSSPSLSETKITKDLWQDDAFQDVPVGIREFMKQEKRLKEKHEREARASK